jgi:ABC-type glutathione transport system ATPase component
VSALELTDVVVDYERRGLPPVRAVAGASLDVEGGTIVGLVGESGCGKSTLARAAVGMVGTRSGIIRFVPASSFGCRWSSRTRTPR